MVLRVTNIEADGLLESLTRLNGLNNTVPAVVGYRILQNIHALEDILLPFHTMRDNIIKKYSKDGKTVLRDKDPEAFAACRKEIDELSRLEVEVNIQTFDFKLIEKQDFPLNVIFALDFMIEKSN